MIFIIIWIISGAIGGALMSYGGRERLRTFVPLGIVFAPVVCIFGVTWVLLRFGEDL
jgi:hypothetical protein